MGRWGIVKINKLEIINFGKFNDYTLDFTDNFQVIYGNNEDGKSTIMSFIKLMFYSDHGRYQSLEQRPRDLLMPWNGKPMEGAIELTQNGVNYRIQKVFGDIPSRDKITIIDLSNSETVELPSNTELGEFFFGLDLSGFTRSSFIKQLGNPGPVKKNDIITQKLIDSLLIGDTETNTSNDATEKLEKAMYNMVSRSGTKGSLVESRNELEKLKETKAHTLHQLESQREMREDYENVKLKHAYQNEIKQRLDKIHQLGTRDKISQLLDKQYLLIDKINNISNTSFPFETLYPYLDKGGEVLDLYYKKLESIDSIRSPEDNYTIVTKEEYDEHSDLVKSIDKLAQLKEKSDNDLYFYEDALASATDDFNGQKAIVENLEKNLEELEPLKQDYLKFSNMKTATETLINNHEEELETSKEIWDRERVMHYQSLESSINRLNASKNPATPNIPQLVFAILLIAIGAVGGFTIHPLMFVAPFMGIALLAVVFFNTHKPNPETASLQQIVDLAECQIEDWEYDVEFMTRKDEEEITDLKNSLSFMDSKLEQINGSYNEEAYENAFNELSANKNKLEIKEIELKNVSQNAENTHKSIEDNLEKLGLVVNQGSTISDFIMATISEKESLLNAMINGKGFMDSEQFNQAYYNAEKISQEKERVENLESEAKQLEERFINLISNHTPVADIVTAESKFNQLAEEYNSCIELKREIDLTGKNLGLEEDHSIPMLESLLKETEGLNSDLLKQDPKKLRERLEELEKEGLLDKMEAMQKSLVTPPYSIEQLDRSINLATEKTGEEEDYYNSLVLAFEMMKKAEEEMRQSFGPILNDKTGDIFSALTNEKYSSVTVNKNYDIMVKDSAHFREWQYLSSGTIDQAYLALRLAISQLISPEDNPVPLFLDDVLIQYDSQRSNNAVSFLKDYAEQNNIQIVLFTCHDNIVSMAKDSAVNTSKIIQ